MASNINDNIKEWLKLSNQGLFVEAKNFYFNHLFDDIIDKFINETSSANRCDVLFSILGFTPEPIILTQRALAPSAHVIFTTRKDYETDNEIVSYLEKYLTSSYKIISLDDDSFDTIYNNLKAQMNIFPSSKYVIDITGGKKSMVASAAIFARDFNCNVVYVDYDEYIPELRRPMPGTEKLNIVYSINNDLVNTLDFESLAKKGKKHSSDENNMPQNKVKAETKKDKTPSQVSQRSSVANLGNSNFKDTFNEAFNHYVGEETAISRSWLPSGIVLVQQSSRSILLRHKKTGESISIQRAQLLDYFMKCKRKKASASCFIGGASDRANKLNPAIQGLLNVINFELFGERFKL